MREKKSINDIGVILFHKYKAKYFVMYPVQVRHCEELYEIQKSQKDRVTQECFRLKVIISFIHYLFYALRISPHPSGLSSHRLSNQLSIFLTHQ